MSNSSIWPIDMTLSGVITPGQSRFGSNGNEGALCVPQSSSITEASPLDYLVLHLGQSLWGSYPSAEETIKNNIKNNTINFCCYFCNVQIRSYTLGLKKSFLDNYRSVMLSVVFLQSHWIKTVWFSALVSKEVNDEYHTPELMLSNSYSISLC